jgi:hypothetical protein
MRSVPAALIAVFLVVPLFLAALFTISVSTWVLDRGFYAELIDDERLYEVPKTADRESLEWAAQATGITLLRDPALVKQIVTPGYMRSQALSVLNQAFDFVEGRSRSFDPLIDLIPLKKALTAMGGTRAALASRTPDSIRLSEMPETRYIPPRWWGVSGFSALGALVLADVILLVLAGGFWVAAAFIGGANARERLLWLGGCLAPPAALVFLSGLGSLVPLAGGWMWAGIRSAGLESLGYGPGFPAALFDAARHAVGRVATGFLATGAVAAGIAVAMIVIAVTMPTTGVPAEQQREGSA